MNLFIPNEHSKKEVVLNQIFELGDLFFIEPIYRHYHNLGYEVIAPVNPEYLWVQYYIPYVKFKNKKTFPYKYEQVQQDNDGRLHIPLRFAHPLYRGYELHYGDDRKNWMRDKYLFLGLDENLFRTMQFERNFHKEQELKAYIELKQAVNLSGEYNFVNRFFGGSFERIKITPHNNLPEVSLQKIEGFTLLDWLGIIEEATNIYTPETSLIYLIESFPMKAKEIHLYPRYPFLEDVNYIKNYLLKPNWFFHDSRDLQ